MQHISYGHMSLNADENLWSDLIKAYQDVFADPPWNEWKKCAVCGTNFGVDQKEALEAKNFIHCGEPLGEFWPADTVRSDFLKALERPSASCWLAYSGDRPIGFCLGYPIDGKELEEKLGIEFLPNLQKMFGPRSNLAYQDDLGVVKEFQRAKIGTQLVKHRHKDLVSAGAKTGIVRTKQFPEPSNTFTWYTDIGFKIVARYPDGRVILARDYEFLGRVLGIE